MVQFNTISEILDGVSENDIGYVKFQFSDLGGVFRELEVPTSFLETAFSKGVPFDSSAGGFSWSTGADIVLKPDPRTFSIIDLSSDEKYARVICELCYLDGQPFEGCPRSTLKTVVRKIYQSGYTFYISSSVHFFLLDAGFNAGNMEKSSSDVTNFKYGNEVAVEKVKQEILRSLSASEVDILSFHRGREIGQYAVVLKEGSALRIADNILTVKQIIRDAALKFGLHATFMPKPMTSKEGLGMPFTLSLLKNDINEFYHPDKEMMLSDSARYFIGGIFKHIRGICAVANPTVNSYKRLVKKSEAPHYVTWSTVDRCSLIQIPSSRGRATKIELRNADVSCNPYLALSLVLSAGISGINEQLLPNNAVNFETHDYSESEKESYSQGTLPGTFVEAVENFKCDQFLQNVLGDMLSKGIIQKADAEWDDYISCVHQWEIDRYL
ncbi:glutamine synthetase family protein [Methanolapillus millepedarum]|uniref:Glutamine synthetase n=1 Tax=Methanolapillus millepedarum TaxID=3028296 RepID=A0AA96V3M5_9EURY|nr:Glutamine synthetase [Methanosarcinaceae archaeon Ac7]